MTERKKMTITDRMRDFLTDAPGPWPGYTTGDAILRLAKLVDEALAEIAGANEEDGAAFSLLRELVKLLEDYREGGRTETSARVAFWLLDETGYLLDRALRLDEQGARK